MKFRALGFEGTAHVIFSDAVVSWQCIHSFVSGNIDEYASSDDRGNGRRIALARPPVTAPVRFFVSVIPMVVIARCGMAQAVDLCGHCHSGTARSCARPCRLVLLSFNVFGGPK